MPSEKRLPQKKFTKAAPYPKRDNNRQNDNNRQYEKKPEVLWDPDMGISFEEFIEQEYPDKPDPAFRFFFDKNFPLQGKCCEKERFIRYIDGTDKTEVALVLCQVCFFTNVKLYNLDLSQ